MYIKIFFRNSVPIMIYLFIRTLGFCTYTEREIGKRSVHMDMQTNKQAVHMDGFENLILIE